MMGSKISGLGTTVRLINGLGYERSISQGVIWLWLNLLYKPTDLWGWLILNYKSMQLFCEEGLFFIKSIKNWCEWLNLKDKPMLKCGEGLILM